VGVPAHDPRAAATVLSPHLDDAVWACFSLLIGEEPLVVATAFAGIPSGTGWWDERCGITDSAGHVRKRMAEDRAVLASLGRDAVHLPLLDGQYRDDGLDPAEIVSELTNAIPATSRVYAWAGIGDHPDHELVRDAGLAVARSGVPVTLVTDYCYSTRHGWPTWVEEPGSTAADAQWERAIGAAVGEALRHPRVRRLTEAESDRKLAAMRGYVTQYEHIEAEEPRWQADGLPPSDPAKRAVEVFYDLDVPV
jgi:LmbE family N-acetylglucosaminyl deacetylase